MGIHQGRLVRVSVFLPFAEWANLRMYALGTRQGMSETVRRWIVKGYRDDTGRALDSQKQEGSGNG